jgi:hypothetical protein
MFLFKEEPVKKEEDKKRSSTGKKDWRGCFDCIGYLRVITEHGSKSFPWSQIRRRSPDKEQGKQAPYQKDCKQHPPQEKPPAVFWLHRAENFCINDGIVDTTDDLKHTKTDYGQDDCEYFHKKKYESRRIRILPITLVS